jgi:hypothetical protein
MSTKNKIYILGDSFCSPSTLPIKNKSQSNYFWAREFYKSFEKTHELVLDAMPSRDVQTIIDNWIKLLKHIKKDDILIVCIPFFIRIRVPLHSKDFMVNKYDDLEIINRFVTHHSWYTSDDEKIYAGRDIVEKEDLDVHIQFFEQIFFESEAVEQNYNEVIQSLYDLTNCNKYLFSWDTMKNKIDEIEYKDDLTKKIGWSTLADLYQETNGKEGIEGDFHWDYKFQKKFTNYLLEKFKK